MDGTELVLRPVQPPQIVIDLGDPAPLIAAGLLAIADSKDLVIDSDTTMELAQEMVGGWKGQVERIEAWRKGITKPMDDAKKIVMDHVRPAIDAFAKAEEDVKAKCKAFYRAEQERQARERAEAERQAREERQRLEAEARAADERARREREEAQRKEAAAQQAEGEERAQLERDAAAARLREAEAQEQASTSAAVAQVITAPSAQVAELPKARGMSFRGSLDGELVDLTAAVEWFLANRQFIACISIDMAKVKSTKKALGEGFQPAGIRFEADVSVGSRVARG
jgi:hypothetical protein